MTGTEVDRVYTHGVTALDYFVVGRVLEREQHPDADRLSVCQRRRSGEGDVAQIVCGAPNVAAGQTVAVALPGAVMPDGTRLKRAKLRGVDVPGHDPGRGRGRDRHSTTTGSWSSTTTCSPGTPLADVLPIATDVLELEITSNRPDCLSIYGAAREVHAATGAPLNPPPWLDDPGTPGPVEGVTIEVEAPDLCPRFTARLFEDVKIGPSPAWLKARLMASGQRPINNVVDITNYVMLLTGQPLHAFDWDLVAGGRLVVRWAGDGEKMTTLDDARAHAGLRHGPDLRRRRADVDRRASWAASAPRSSRRHDARADGGGQLERPEPAAHLAAARPAHGGLRRASRRGSRPRSRCGARPSRRS